MANDGLGHRVDALLGHDACMARPAADVNLHSIAAGGADA